MSYIPEPVTRIDKYLAYIAGNMDTILPNHPITRKEHYLAAWAEKNGFEDVDVTGEPPLTLENTIGKPFKGLKLYGKSKQVTTTGAQLLDQTKATVDGWNIKYDIPLEKSKTYTFTNGEKAANSVALFGVNPDEADENLTVKYLSPKESYTFTCAKDYASILIGGSDEKTVTDGEYMLNAGSTPLPWEPYTGGLPSPSPDYPQEIQSAGYQKGIEVGVRGNNLAKPQLISGLKNGITITKYADGSYNFKGTCTKNTYNTVCSFDTEIGETYYFSGGAKNGSNTTFQTYLLSKVEVLRYNFEKGSFTAKEKEYYLNCAVYKGNTVDFTIKPMLNLGSETLPFEPYHEPQSLSISTPTGLPAIPVGTDGNYTDADGNQWICDEIDFGRGVYMQRAAFTTVDGNAIKFKERGEFWNLPDGSAPGCGDQNTAINIFFSKNMFGTNGRFDFVYTLSTNMKKYFKTPDELNEFCKNKYDAGTPLTLYYALTTPIETPLTDEQIAAYKQLHTYKGTTIIDNDAGAYMSVRYEKMK